MSDLPIARTTTHLEVARSTPRKHVGHDDGSFSLIVADDPSTIYVCGTPDELLTWARQIWAIAIELHNNRYEQQWVDTTTDQPRVLTFDECARLGLDGTGRS